MNVGDSFFPFPLSLWANTWVNAGEKAKILEKIAQAF
jgi:hypothetical protein